jgi:hypothetical protein
MDSKYEHAKFIIERFDHYYDTINSKGSFYIALNSFIFGGLCTGYISIENKVTQGFWFWLLLVLPFIICIISILYTITAVSPFLKDNDNNDDNNSLVFFGGIAKHSLNHFIEKIRSENDDSIREEMYRQIHCLAKGLKSKFDKLFIVSYLLAFQFVLITIFIIYIIKNYTP